MRKFFILLIVPFFTNAQNNQHAIDWKSTFIIESNGLEKEALKSIIYGGKITDDMKNSWIRSGKENNIINVEISNELKYNYHFKNKNIGFKFSDINILNVNFKDDLLRLTLQGNFDYQDETLEFDGASIRINRFQKYTLAYGAKMKKLKLQTGISYLKGNHHLSYIIQNGSIYTAPNGNYLDVEYSINSFISDTSDFSLFANNGNGIAVDLSSEFKLDQYEMSFSIMNLGFIMWNTSSMTLAQDSIFRFEGSNIEDIYNFNDSIIEVDDIIEEFKKPHAESFKSYIPATIHLSFSGKTEYKYLRNYTTGIIRKWQPYMDNTSLSFKKIQQGLKESNFSPLYYVRSTINTKYIDIDPSISYGGYSNETNIGLTLSVGNKNKLIIGTYHLEELFKEDDTRALSIYLNLQLKF